MYEQFTDRARKIMQLANQEALRFNHEYVGTEHLLLGLVKEGTGVAGIVLANLGVELRKVRLEVEKIVQAGPDKISGGKLPMTPRMKKAIEYAYEEARFLAHDHVGTEHLLLGLVRESEGVAALVLMNLGLRLQVVREEVLNLLGNPEAAVKAGPAPVLPRPPVDLEHMPTYARWLAEELDRLVARIQIDKEEFVASVDFENAAYLRDVQDTLRKLRADLIRQWLKDA